MTAVLDAYAEADPTLCEVCGRDACEDHLPSVRGSDISPAGLPADDASRTKRLIALTLDELKRHTFPARPALLMRDGEVILRAGHLGEVVAGRGIGKTWLLQTLALVMASQVRALGFHAPEPRRVLYIDGEMDSQELKDRFLLLAERLNVPAGTNVTTLAADWQEDYLRGLDTQAGQHAVEPFVEAADAVILDNRSCLFDPEGEKDPTAWQPAQHWLLALRRRRKAVLMAHHANRQGGARGHSKAEDALNLVLNLARPDDYSADQGSRFVLTFEKSRGAHGVAVAPFTARLTPEGWQVESTTHTNSIASRLSEYVRLADKAGEPVKTATAAIAGARVNKQQGLKAWAELKGAGIVCSHPNGGFRVA